MRSSGKNDPDFLSRILEGHQVLGQQFPGTGQHLLSREVLQVENTGQLLFVAAQRFSLVQTAWLAWFVGFVIMWLLIANLGVLPYRLSLPAVPLRLLEAFMRTSNHGYNTNSMAR